MQPHNTNSLHESEASLQRSVWCGSYQRAPKAPCLVHGRVRRISAVLHDARRPPYLFCLFRPGSAEHEYRESCKERQFVETAM